MSFLSIPNQLLTDAFCWIQCSSIQMSTLSIVGDFLAPWICYSHNSWYLSLFPSRRRFLTLDLLKEHRRALVNRWFLREEEMVHHFLVHFSKARLLWDLLLAVSMLSGFSHWQLERPFCCSAVLLRGTKGKAWMMASLVIFWTIWQERNKEVLIQRLNSL